MKIAKTPKFVSVDCSEILISDQTLWEELLEEEEGLRHLIQQDQSLDMLGMGGESINEIR